MGTADILVAVYHNRVQHHSFYEILPNGSLKIISSYNLPALVQSLPKGAWVVLHPYQHMDIAKLFIFARLTNVKQ